MSNKKNNVIIGGIVSSSVHQGHSFKIQCRGSDAVAIKKMVSQFLADKGFSVFTQSSYHG